MEPKLNYPVFVLPKKSDMIFVFFKEVDLKSTTTEFLDKGGFVGDIIVDAFGNKYEIEKAYFKKYRGLLGYNPLLKGRQILVDFHFAMELHPIALDEFKRIVHDRINKNKRLWLSSWNIDELQAAIANSISFEEISHLLK